MSGSDVLLGPPSPPGYDSRLPVHRSTTPWATRASSNGRAAGTSYSVGHSRAHSAVDGVVAHAVHWNGPPSESGTSMVRESETADSSPRSSMGSTRLHGAYGGGASFTGFMWPMHVKAPTAALPSR